MCTFVHVQNELNPNFTAIGKYCCAQFEVGDKFIMAFDHLKLLGPEPAKYVFQVYKKGQVHEDKVVQRIVLSSQAGGYELVRMLYHRCTVAVVTYPQSLTAWTRIERSLRPLSMALPRSPSRLTRATCLPSRSSSRR